MKVDESGPNRRDILLGADALAAASAIVAEGPTMGAQAQQQPHRFYLRKTLTQPALKLATPHVINLIVDRRERKAIDLPYIHSWTAAHFGRIMREFATSVKREPLIPAGAPLDHIPARKT